MDIAIITTLIKELEPWMTLLLGIPTLFIHFWLKRKNIDHEEHKDDNASFLVNVGTWNYSLSTLGTPTNIFDAVEATI